MPHLFHGFLVRIHQVKNVNVIVLTFACAAAASLYSWLFPHQKMAELNKFTAEHQEEAGSDGEEDGARQPAADAETSSQLIVQQVRTVDQDGNLKVVYPSKTDLSKEFSNFTVIW